MGELLERWHAALAAQSPAAVATVIEGPGTGSKMLVTAEDHVGTAGNDELDRATIEAVRGMLEGGRTGTIHLGERGQRRMEDVTVFVQSFAPPPRMYVFGAIDFASAVARVGKFMGYRVIVCDARAVFATRERFPSADEIVVAWPDEYLKTAEVDGRSVITVLTHDPKFDVPVLKEALDTPAGYIGAMGSRRTHDDRLKRLREEGVTDAELARLRSPLGLDIGARTPEETAVSIAAEIVQTCWGGTGRPLTALEGPIHHQGAVAR
jgi:xanthine dehydrogenase accessory factor